MEHIFTTTSRQSAAGLNLFTCRIQLYQTVAMCFPSCSFVIVFFNNSYCSLIYSFNTIRTRLHWHVFAVRRIARVVYRIWCIGFDWSWGTRQIITNTPSCQPGWSTQSAGLPKTELLRAYCTTLFATMC